MKKILCTFLLMFSINGYCEWTYFSETTDGVKFYIDVPTIKNRDGILSVWMLEDYSKIQKDGFQSELTLYGINCNLEKLKLLQVLKKKKRMGKGDYTIKTDFDNSWLYAPPETIAEKFINTICKYEEHY